MAHALPAVGRSFRGCMVNCISGDQFVKRFETALFDNFLVEAKDDCLVLFCCELHDGIILYLQSYT